MWIDPEQIVEVEYKLPQHAIHDGCIVNAFSRTLSVKGHQPSKLHEVIGIVFKRSRPRHSLGKPVIEYIEAPTPIRVAAERVRQLKYELIKPGDLVTARVFDMPQGARAASSYWLPDFFGTTQNESNEFTAHLGQYLIEIEPSKFSIEQVILPQSKSENVRKAEEYLALSNKIYSHALVELSKDTAVYNSITKLPPSIDDAGQEAYNKLWKVYVTWGNLKQVVEFQKLWRKDVKIQAFVSKESRLAFGQGSIINVSHQDGYSYKMVFSLTPIERRESDDDWEWGTNNKNHVVLKVLPHVNRVNKRVKFWKHNTASKLSMSNDSQGRILAALLGTGHTNPLSIPELSLSPYEDPELNKEQLQMYQSLLHAKPGVIFQLAPFGSGKTYGVLKAVAKLLEIDPKATIILTTHGNMQLKKLLHEAAKRIPEVPKLVIQAGPAKEEFKLEFEPYQSSMLLSTVEQLLNELHQKQEQCRESNERECNKDSKKRKIFEKYVKNCEARPQRADEKAAFKAVKDMLPKLPQLIFLTTALLEDFVELCEECTHLIIDEGGQVNTDQTLIIVSQMLKLQKLVITGDPVQLLHYREDIPEIVRPFTESLLTYVDKLQVVRSPIQVIQLIQSYRSHPELTNCISHAAYEGKVVPVAKANERSDFQVALPNPELPILLLHQDDPDQREERTTSRKNETHAEIAEKILKEFRVRMPKVDITVLCLYSAEKRAMRKRLAGLKKMEITSVDSYQGNESDIIYILTTRSVCDGDQVGPLDFIHNPRRAATALTRARHGIVLHGNLNLLARGQLWQKYIKRVCEKTRIISPNEYWDSLKQRVPIPVMPTISLHELFVAKCQWGAKKNRKGKLESESDVWAGECMKKLQL